MAESHWGNVQYEKGDLVVCHTSAGRQQNPWIVSFVERHGNRFDSEGLLLRAIGSDATCDYSNESFIRITGIPERLLWEGEKNAFAEKVHKAYGQISDRFWQHKWRGLEFDKGQEGLAHLYVGEWMGGLGSPTKPYVIDLTFDKRTTIANIRKQMTAQGFGTREFEPMDAAYDGPMNGLKVFTREAIVNELRAAGLDIAASSPDAPE